MATPALTATINSITLQADPNSGLPIYATSVTFADSVTNYSYTKNYNFPLSVTAQQASQAIQSDGQAIKGVLAQAVNVSSYVGTVITL